MRVVCAWCQYEGRPALLGEVEPLHDPTETHGICAEHHRALLGQLLGEVAATVEDTREAAREAVARLQAWVAEGRGLVLEPLREAEAMAARTAERYAAAEAEQARLEEEVARLREAVAAALAENEALHATERELARQVAQLLDRALEHWVQPLHALARHLQTTRR